MPNMPDVGTAAASSSAYFMVRVQRAVGADGDGAESLGAPALFGQVERLGTGEKQRFVTGDELLRLVDVWTRPAR